MQNSTAALEDSPLKHLPTTWSSSRVPRYLQKRSKNLLPPQILQANNYSSFIRNCQNLEATKMFFSGWTERKLWYIRTMEYYSVLKRNELWSHEKRWRKLRCTLLSGRSQTEKARYTLWFQLFNILEKAKLWGQRKDRWLPGGGQRKGWQEEHRGFLRQWKLFCVTLYVFVRTQRMYNTESEP